MEAPCPEEWNLSPHAVKIPQGFSVCKIMCNEEGKKPLLYELNAGITPKSIDFLFPILNLH